MLAWVLCGEPWKRVSNTGAKWLHPSIPTCERGVCIYIWRIHYCSQEEVTLAEPSSPISDEWHWVLFDILRTLSKERECWVFWHLNNEQSLKLLYAALELPAVNIVFQVPFRHIRWIRILFRDMNKSEFCSPVFVSGDFLTCFTITFTLLLLNRVI